MKSLLRIISNVGLVFVFVVGLILPNSVLAVDIFVSSFPGGEIYKVDSDTGVMSLVVDLNYPAEDGVIDFNGISYWGGITIGVKRVNTNDNTVLPDVGTNICAPEGGSIDTAGNIYFNTRIGDLPTYGCAPMGVWKIANGTASTAVNVLRHFSRWGEGTLVVKTGPFAGHLLATDSTGCNDPYGGAHGAKFVSPFGPGFGKFGPHQ